MVKCGEGVVQERTSHVHTYPLQDNHIKIRITDLVTGSRNYHPIYPYELCVGGYATWDADFANKCRVHGWHANFANKC